FFQAEDGIRDFHVTGVQTCALPISYIPPNSTTPVEKTFTLNTTVTVMFSPAVTIGKEPSVLSFDFNAAQSLTFDSAGNVTGINQIGRASCRERVETMVGA